MKVYGYDCSIVIKTTNVEMDVPYSDETIREAISLLEEEAAIEGDIVCRGIRRSEGITGCVVTPLTINTTPLLLYLVMGGSTFPVFVSETKNLFKHSVDLLPFEDCPRFDLIQDRNNEQRGGLRKLYEDCRVKSFELRIMRGETVKLKLDISSESPAVPYPYHDQFIKNTGERFSSDYVKYRINRNEYNNIYGLTISTKKENGIKTEVWIKRSLEHGDDIPEIIEELQLTAQLLRTQYEPRYFGMFRLTVTRLVLISDETEINSSDAVIGPLRYYVTGKVYAEVFE